MPTTTAIPSPTKSVLVIGASGRTGTAVVRQFAHTSKDKPEVHGFVRNPDKLSQDDTALLSSVIQGDARNQNDLVRALDESNADFIIVAVGSSDNNSTTDIRAASAAALVNVLQEPRFHHIRILVVSYMGAGTSEAKGAIGALMANHFHHVLRDHSLQELEFLPLQQRTTIVRPTGLTQGSPAGYLVAFGDDEKSPTPKTDRSDLAIWIVQEAVDGKNRGRSVNLTGVKRHQIMKRANAARKCRMNQIQSDSRQ